MLKSDFVNAVAFMNRGIVDLMTWCEDDEGEVQEVMREEKQKSIGLIG